MNNFFSASPLLQPQGLSLVRIIVGLFMIYHGIEVFNKETMAGYSTWKQFSNTSFALVLVYIGKSAELLAGILLTIGLFTRIASLVLIVTMLYIAFFVGNGKVWYEDQH